MPVPDYIAWFPRLLCSGVRPGIESKTSRSQVQWSTDSATMLPLAVTSTTCNIKEERKKKLQRLRVRSKTS